MFSRAKSKHILERGLKFKMKSLLSHKKKKNSCTPDLSHLQLLNSQTFNHLMFTEPLEMKFDQRRERSDAAMLNWWWCTNARSIRPISSQVCHQGYRLTNLSGLFWAFKWYIVWFCSFGGKKEVFEQIHRERKPGISGRVWSCSAEHLPLWHWAFRRNTNKTKPTAAVTFSKVHPRSAAHGSWTFQKCGRSELWGESYRGACSLK